MNNLTRRSVLRASLAAAAASGFARPYIANAQAKTASLWLAQGFVPEEDVAIKKLAADYAKQSGNQIDVSIVPFAPLRDKEVSAVTSGVVPDIMETADFDFAPLQSWAGRLEDVSDVVETQKAQFSEVCLVQNNFYDNVIKRRAYYCVPWKAAAVPFHVWKSLVEKGGAKVSDIPNTWTAYLDFFKPLQKKLQAQGMRHTYSYGWEISTVGVDPINTFNAFMIAYGGKDLVTPDGKAHVDDPQVKQAVAKAMARLAADFTEGYVPHSVVNWNDADDNNAFHSKLCVMDFDGSLSTELALIHNKEAYDDILTHGIPNDDAGKPIPAQVATFGCVIPKGAKNGAVARDFLKYAIQPEVLSSYLKGGLGRWALPMTDYAKKDPWWGNTDDPHKREYFQETIFGETIPIYEGYSPAIAQANAEHVFQIGIANVATHSAHPEQEAEKALKRIGEIFAKYPITA